jgi:hypothetical protein
MVYTTEAQCEHCQQHIVVTSGPDRSGDVGEALRSVTCPYCTLQTRVACRGSIPAAVQRPPQGQLVSAL